MNEQSNSHHHEAHKPFGHRKVEWANRLQQAVDKIMDWPTENWLIFGAGLVIGLILG